MQATDNDRPVFNMSSPVTVSPPNSEGIQEIAIDAMRIDTAGIDGYFPIPAFPEQFLAPIGAIVVGWGGLEQTFDELLRNCLIINGKEDHLRVSFRSRMAMFRREVTAALGDIEGIPEFIDNNLGRCNGLYWKRNVLAHGQLALAMTVLPLPLITESDVVCKICGEARQDGRTFEHSFSMQDLKDLFYEISRTHGNLRCIAAPDEPYSQQLLPEKVASHVRDRYRHAGL